MVDAVEYCLDVVEALCRLLFDTAGDDLTRCWIDRQLS
jgi:hypothetical protein